MKKVSEDLVDNALRKASRDDLFRHATAVASWPDRVTINHILDLAGECKRRGFYATEGELLKKAADQRFASIKNCMPLDECEEYPE